MPYTYIWPERESFLSAYSCRFLPKEGSSKFSNIIFGPVYNLFDLSRPVVLIFSWAIVFLMWYLLTYTFPIAWYNSTDGEYIDDTRIIIFALVFYFVTAFIFISVTNSKGCKQLEQQAEDYLYGPKPPLPYALAKFR